MGLILYPAPTPVLSAGPCASSQGFHKAVLEVDEQGTKAAAATGIRFVFASVPRHPIVKLNRPFIVVIYSSNTDSISFMGKLKNPPKMK